MADEIPCLVDLERLPIEPPTPNESPLPFHCFMCERLFKSEVNYDTHVKEGHGLSADEINAILLPPKLEAVIVDDTEETLTEEAVPVESEEQIVPEPQADDNLVSTIDNENIASGHSELEVSIEEEIMVDDVDIEVTDTVEVDQDNELEIIPNQQLVVEVIHRLEPIQAVDNTSILRCLKRGCNFICFTKNEFEAHALVHKKN